MKKFISKVVAIAVLSSLVSSCGTVKAQSKTVDVSFDSDDFYFDWKNEAETIKLSNNKDTKITDAGVYELTGTAKDASVTVDAGDSDRVVLVLNNANISSSKSAPINIENADKVLVLLETGTENSLTMGDNAEINGEINTDLIPSAALYSSKDLSIGGNGTLSINSNYVDGITCKDDLKITDGTFIINSNLDGITGKDLLAVKTADITINAGKDGMRATSDSENEDKGNILICDGSFNIISANDAVQASKLLQIDGGSFNIATGGGHTENIHFEEIGGPQFGMQRGGSNEYLSEKEISEQDIINSDGNMRISRPQHADMQPQSDMVKTDGAPTDITPQNGIATDSKQQNNKNQSDKLQSSDENTESQKGLKSTAGITINGGNFTIDSNDDAVHSGDEVAINSGEFNLFTSDDAIHSDTSVLIKDGKININFSYEGIEGADIAVAGGEITLTSSDDGINVNDKNGTLIISGGIVSISASGDGIDSNGKVLMTDGTVTVEGPISDGNAALDYDSEFNITGGTLTASGSSGMAMAPSSSSSQASVLMYFTEAVPAGTTISLRDKNGNKISSITPSKQFNSVVFSEKNYKVNESYSIYSGDTMVVEFTPTASVTYLSESGITERPQGFGGHQGGGMGRKHTSLNQVQ